jgi:hypothetical protein
MEFEGEMESHTYDIDERKVDLGLVNPELTRYLCIKFHRGWFRSTEFLWLMELCQGLDKRWHGNGVAQEENKKWDELLEEVPHWQEKIDTYCRSSGATVMILETERVRIESMLQTKADAKLKGLALTCSAIIAYGERIVIYLEDNDLAMRDVKVMLLFLLSSIALYAVATGVRSLHRKSKRIIPWKRRICDGFTIQIILGIVCFCWSLSEALARLTNNPLVDLVSGSSSGSATV